MTDYDKFNKMKFDDLSDSEPEEDRIRKQQTSKKAMLDAQAASKRLREMEEETELLKRRYEESKARQTRMEWISRIGMILLLIAVWLVQSYFINQESE